MAWQSSLSLDEVQSNQIAEATFAPVFKPFDARLYEPMVKPAPMPTMIEDVSIVDERQRDREEVKTNLQSIMRNRLLSETARVAAARELTRILDNEEIEELREEVKRLTAIVNENTPDESELPPHLRKRR